jgi:hypothetical protein
VMMVQKHMFYDYYRCRKLTSLSSNLTRYAKSGDRRSDDESYILFSCQNWDLRTELPTLVSINCIKALRKEIEHDKYWPIGIQYPAGDKTVKAIAFSSDLNMLRIGSQAFIKNTDGEFLPSFSFGFNQTGTELPLEEFAASSSYVALATRLKKQPKKDDDTPTVILEASGRPTILPKQEKDSSDDESPCSSDDDWLDFDSASESWSDGSTNVDEETESEDETPLGATKSSRSSSVSSSASEKVTMTREELLKDSDDETDENSLDNKNPSNESDDTSSDESESTKDPNRRRPSNRIAGQKVAMNTLEKNGLLLIYDISSLPSPRLLFRFRRPLSTILKDSPPVFHPRKSLLVWPLFGGEILFADFQLKTFFTRKARVSASNSEF